MSTPTGAITTIEAPDDTVLLARLVARDTSALALLYDRHARAAFGAALHLLSDPSAAEWVVQDVFFALWRQAPMVWKDRTPVRGWLLTRIVLYAQGRGIGSRAVRTMPML